jgi:predicted TIM-barrel fold metal-dependent hydrolase
MKRRSILKSIGMAGPALLLGSRDTRAATPATERPVRVGGLDLSSIEIVDTHVHPPNPMTLSESYELWNSSFVDAMLPSYDYEGKEALRSELEDTFRQHIYDMPRQTGYNNYVARVYGVPSAIEAFDKVVQAGIDRGFTGYVTSILDREKIAKVLLEKREPAPSLPDSPIPRNRFIWSFPIIDLIQPEWAKERDLTSARKVSTSIGEVMQACVENGCRGFKSAIAYYRPLGINVVDEQTAERAFQQLLRNPPTEFVPGRSIANYSDPELAAAFRTYQDFLLRDIYIKAGELGTPVIIHSAVALHPALRFDFNDPLELRNVFLDDEIKRVETRFLLIHTGYPRHHFVAAMLSQFPNVYTDLSFYSKFPGVLEETLRAFLALAPNQKVMHGSDSNNVPEEIGYCAWNVRHVLAKVLRDYLENYGWTEKNCAEIAHNVLHRNAERLFEIPAAS